jgi:hypothetical protein
MRPDALLEREKKKKTLPGEGTMLFEKDVI